MTIDYKEKYIASRDESSRPRPKSSQLCRRRPTKLKKQLEKAAKKTREATPEQGDRYVHPPEGAATGTPNAQNDGGQPTVRLNKRRKAEVPAQKPSLPHLSPSMTYLKHFACTTSRPPRRDFSVHVPTKTRQAVVISLLSLACFWSLWATTKKRIDALTLHP
jgi:hypothetical protein